MPLPARHTVVATFLRSMQVPDPLQVSGALHARQFLHSIPEKVVTDANLITFRDMMDHILEQHRKKQAGLG